MVPKNNGTIERVKNTQVIQSKEVIAEITRVFKKTKFQRKLDMIALGSKDVVLLDIAVNEKNAKQISILGSKGGVLRILDKKFIAYWYDTDLSTIIKRIANKHNSN